MFIIDLRYIKPLTEVDQYVEAHRAYLDKGYKNNILIASGPKNPREGGIIISNAKSRAELDDFIANDPFYMQGIAVYQVIEFNPVKYHPDFAVYIA